MCVWLREGGGLLGLPSPTFFEFWRVINILQGVIGSEPWDDIGTMITAQTPPLKLISPHVK